MHTELDNHYLRYHADKKRRIQERGEKSCKTDPEAMAGAIELLEELYVTHLILKVLSDIPQAVHTSRSDTPRCFKRLKSE